MGLFYKSTASGVAIPNPSWFRIIIAVVLLCLFLLGGICTARTPEYAEVSATLLRSFEVALVGFLALLGIEGAKK